MTNLKTGIKRGFTLIELLVAISIIATLTAILLPNFMGARERAKDAQKIMDLESLKNGLRLYYNDNQTYPVGDGVVLGNEMSQYVPDVLQIGHTYYQTKNGDGFNLCVGLESGVGDDDINSQKKCGSDTIGVCGGEIGATVDKVFVVCAN